MCMATLTELTQEYLDLAAERGKAQLAYEFEEMVDYMKASRAIAHGEYVRSCYAPRVFTLSLLAQLTSDMQVLYGIFEKVFEAFFTDSAYRALWGFGPQEEALVLSGGDRWRTAMLPMARIDFFFDDATGAYTFCEFNTDGTSAMIEDYELVHAQERYSSAWRAFTQRHRCETAELLDSWVDTLLNVYRRLRPAAVEPPRVAIVDYLECSYANELALFCERFQERGIACCVCDVRDLTYTDGLVLDAQGNPVDAIYRRAVTSDVLAHWDESQALIQGAANGSVVLVGDFYTQLVHNKTIFRMLLHPATLAFLSPEEQDYVHAHVPYTAAYNDCSPEVLADVAAHKDRWILKPQDSYASQGVRAGVECMPEEWRQFLAAIEADPTVRANYIVQAFHTPFTSKNYGFVDESLSCNTYYNLTGLYVYDSHPAGMYSRVSLTPIISTQYSEKTLPTLFVDA